MSNIKYANNNGESTMENMLLEILVICWAVVAFTFIIILINGEDR